jgi:polyisoprenoid-binding protein YceI
MHKSNMKYFYILATAFFLQATIHAGEVAASAAIRFAGTSTLHGFSGTVATQPFSAIFREDGKTSQVHISATATINVLDMNTQHKKRDKNMFKMLDAENFTLITGVLTDAPLPKEGGSEVPLRLTIRNVEQTVTATLSDLQRDGNSASCLMTFSVSLKAFDLKPPSVLGVIRVGDTVTVECTVQGTTK